MKTILFVCTGNICRSPMAEGIFRHAVRNRAQQFRILSAGVGAINGQAASGHAVSALREIGIDLSGFRSRMLTGQTVGEADLIFGMTRGHVEAIALLYPQAMEKTLLLREFDETLDFFEKDISDPIGGSYEVYLNCRDQIEQGIHSMLKYLEQADGPSAEGAGTAKATTIALGADHGGVELKNAIREHLQQSGCSVVDFGTNSTESTDYPDYAQAVADSVSSHRADLGLLVCTTGVGMSISAN